MGNVVSITGPKVFTLDEVNDLIGIVSRITCKYENEIEKLLANQRFYARTGAPQSLIDSSDIKVQSLLIEWGKKMVKLGGKVQGSRTVSFDSGFGYWSWMYPDTTITHFYDYHEDFFKRRRIGIIRTEGA